MNVPRQVTQQLIFELRYWDGALYLDRCGRTLKALMKESPEWLSRGNSTPETSALVSSINGCHATFGIKKLDLTIERAEDKPTISVEETTNWVGQIEQFSSLVLDRLEISSYSRIGCRIVSHFPMQSFEESQEWIMSRNLFSLNPALAKLFESQTDSVLYETVLNGPDRWYKVSLTSVENQPIVNAGAAKLRSRARDLPANQRSAFAEQFKKLQVDKVNSPYASVIDIDVYVEEPNSEINIFEFCRSSVEQSLERTSQIARGL